MLEPDYFSDLRVDISDRYRDLEQHGFERGRDVVIADVKLSKAKEKKLGSGFRAAGTSTRSSILTWPDGLSIYVERPRSRPALIWRGSWQMIRPLERQERPDGMFVSFNGRPWLIEASPYPELYDSIERGEWAGPFG